MKRFVLAPLLLCRSNAGCGRICPDSVGAEVSEDLAHDIVFHAVSDLEAELFRRGAPEEVVNYKLMIADGIDIDDARKSPVSIAKG